MANNYYEATGVLVLDRVTPVIQALFGAFALDESHPGNGQAYIAQIAETTNPQWPDVLDGLEDLATQLGIPMPDDERLSIPLRQYHSLFVEIAAIWTPARLDRAMAEPN